MNPKMTVFVVFMAIMASGFTAVQSEKLLIGDDLTIMVDGSGKDRESIDPHAFDGLERMTGLTLARNKLTGLETYVFPKLNRLKNLDLSNNKLSNTAGTFVNLGSVETLDVSNNEFKQLDSQYLFGLSKKSEIILGDGHHLEKILGDVFVPKTPEATKKSNEIKKRSRRSLRSEGSQSVVYRGSALDIRVCVENDTLVKLNVWKTGEVPSEGEKCTRISYENGLMRIPMKINKFAKGWCCGGMPDVEEFFVDEAAASEGFGLILSATGISEIAVGTFDNLPYFNFLDLSSNNLKDLKIVKNLPPTMRYLELSNNSITAVEANSFSNLKEMRTLDLTYNKIEKIQPSAFKDNKHLTMLRLDGNELSNIEQKAFDGLEALENLNLAGNKLTEIKTDVLKLPRLKRLDVSANKITVVKSGALSHLGDIESLRLQNNSITKLQNGAFFGLPQKAACVINVRNTPIKSIQGGLFEKSP